MPHILVIDDDPDILEILRLELEDQFGNTVETSHTAEEAIIAIGRDEYDVIVTNLPMPGIGGNSLIRILLEQGCQASLVLYSADVINPDVRVMMRPERDFFIERKGNPDSEFADLRRIIQQLTVSGSR